MIPKTIHYCWFGGKDLPALAKKCIASWKQFCPDYEIKEWNEKNFDLNACPYVREAYEEKKWAFITDYVRLFVLVSEGGVYMDTDVEVLAPLDEFLQHEAFSGFEDGEQVPTGIMAGEKGFFLFQEMLDYYKDKHFRMEDGTLDLTTNVVTITNICLSHGLKQDNSLQKLDGFVLYPKEVFCPKDHSTGKIHLSKMTRTIHHFSGSWHTTAERISGSIKGRTEEKGIVMKFIGKIIAFPFTFVGRIEREGGKKTINYYLHKYKS